MMDGVDNNPGRGDAKRGARIKPTLYVAVGGSGKEVLLRLRRRILQALWNGQRVSSFETFPVVDFLYFDTYTEKAEEDRKAAAAGEAEDPLRKITELGKADAIQERLDVHKYLAGREIERYPHIESWLPSGELRAIRAEAGAGQVRPISRLLFFDRADQIWNLINAKARRLLENVGNDHLDRLGLEVDRELQVVVICSIAGGTGSGAFLDMGYMCKALRDPRPGKVDLVALTGGAFMGKNDRVLANSYAGLMELEYCMSASALQPYVDRWSQTREARTPHPYDDVYLVDNRNIAQQATGDTNFLYGMVADSLFEALSDPALRGKRWEDLVNQTQYKVEPFHPPMPESVGMHALSFSRAYSSMGQVTLDSSGRLDFERQLTSSAMEMVETFFRLTQTDRSNTPSPDDIEHFLGKVLLVGSAAHFDDFPEYLRKNKPLIPDYDLMGALLRTGSGVGLIQQERDAVRADVDAVSAQPDLAMWPNRVNEVYTKHLHDIVADARSGAVESPLVLQIKAARRRVMDELRDAGKGLRRELYLYLDNQDRGGLHFTASLVQSVRDRLTRIMEQLQQSEAAFGQVADRIYKNNYSKACANLGKAVKGGVFGKADERQSRLFLEQLGSDLSYFMEFTLRARACAEARALLEDVVEEIGQGSALGDGGNSGATGIMKEIEEGRATIGLVQESLRQEIRLLDDARRSTNPFRKFVEGGRLEAIDVPVQDLAEWGRQALGHQGGSRVLFQQMRDDGQRAVILNALRGIARERLRKEESRIQPIHDVLADMDDASRRDLFRSAMTSALPWLNADFQKMDSAFDPKMLSVFVAVENAEAFSRAFNEDLKRALPARFQNKDISYVSSGVRGRVVIYTEISGVALNVLVPLHDNWRAEYEKRTTGTNKLPLHNHKRTDRFSHPTARSLEEVERLRDTLQLYLTGIVSGLLRRRADGTYEMAIRDGQGVDWMGIGSERQLYLTGFLDHQREALRRNLEKFDETLSPPRVLLVAANLSHIAQRAYSPRLERLEGGQELRRKGIAHFAALAARDAYLARLPAEEVQRRFGMSLDTALARLEEKLADWSVEIEGSVQDTNGLEASLNPHDPPDRRARDKRVIDWSRMADDGAILALLGDKATSVASPGFTTAEGEGPPPLPSEQKAYFVAVDNRKDGPHDMSGLKRLKASGQLTEETLIWRKGLANWVAAHTLDELAALFDDGEPPPLPSL